MKHRRRVKGEQVITLQMAQQLKTKNVNVVPIQLFCCQCKAKYLRQTHCIDDQDKFECVTDIDNVTIILPFSLHAFMKTLKSNISEAYEVQVDCLKES